MKEQEQIPTGKVQRAGKFIATGAKIGTNYLKHYGKKLINSEVSKDELHEDNARDIYQSLSQLKGSALKVAQMLSMDKNLLPTAYQQQFAKAQYTAPPLSYPLVVKTFVNQFGKKPEEVFETFTKNAVNAASIGQVHQATIGSTKYAVKIQYPGVGDSVKSDLAMVKPIALRMFDLNVNDYNEFIQEVETRLLEETDYQLELKRSIELSQKSGHIKNLLFPTYFPALSGSKILTMDWIDGKPLGELLKSKIEEPLNHTLGQAMWDFYHHQMHQLKAVHADPHPGNFIVTPEGKLGVIDFGCVKEMSDDFYKKYFRLLNPALLENKKELEEAFFDLRFIYDDDTKQERDFFIKTFSHLVELLGRPFRTNIFDFSDKAYFAEIYTFGEELSKMKELRESKKARGVKDALYINRTYFGLYSILHDMQAKVNTTLSL
jgi:predicted unusual protein kinase regulating ubiquinone biosynthesis (AarF/ABC1/UbiB family)